MIPLRTFIRAGLYGLVLVALLIVAGCGGKTAANSGRSEAVAAAAEQSGAARIPARPDARRVSASPIDIPGPIQRSQPQTVELKLESTELTGQLADGTTYEYWTYNDTVPGPLLRVREGDTVVLTLTNAESSKFPHSIDLHAVNGPGGGHVSTEVTPGKEKSFRFKALNPGVYVYHCATPHIPTHIANGMYGLIVVEPREGLAPVDQEFYVVQGEIYASLRSGETGHATLDTKAMFNEEPNYVVFNGQAKALTGEHTMRAEVGDRIRIFVGNGGPNLSSSFHVIGEVFDTVHPEGATEAVHNVQTTMIPAGGATWVEFTLDVPGTYMLVDHALSRAVDKGALATIEVSGPENPDVYEDLNGTP